MSGLRELLRMGVRNVGRNRRRSLITGAMIAVAVASVVFFKGYTLGIEQVMLSGAVDSWAGALQIQREGYAEAQDFAPLHLDLPDEGPLPTAVQQVPNVRALVPRLRFTGHLSSGEGMATFMGLGMDAGGEAAVCPLGVGTRSQSSAFNALLEGQPLAGEDDGVVVAVELARGLGLKVGDPLTLQVRTKPGSIDTADTVVRGIFRLDDPMSNKLLVLVPLRLAQKVLHMKGRATAFAVGVGDLDGLDQTVGALRKALAGQEPPTRVLPWTEIVPFLRDTIELQSDTFGVVLVVVVLLVLVGVVNTMMMSVLERRREVGTLMAIGFRRRAILWLFLIESLGLGAVASMAGAALGSALVLATHSTGIGFAIPGGATILVHPELRPAHLALAITAALAGAVLAALFPAWRASRMRPIEALRTI
ncbi:MAG: ABC transporter permease [Deltaproteobacteria bacterium]|nr:ABC transporter permease [Deltaproteobacteria bacterium]